METGRIGYAVMRNLSVWRSLHRNVRLCHRQNFVRICVDIYDMPVKEVMKMLQVAVCDDEVLECCNMARKIRDILEEMNIPCIIRQFQNGRELLRAVENFDIVITAPCYLGYLCMADKFCKKYLGASRRNEMLLSYLWD